MNTVTLEFIDNEIKTFNKEIADYEKIIRDSQAAIEKAQNDRNATYGALQQSLKIREMLVPKISEETKQLDELDLAKSKEANIEE
jgi:hypothetical protein